MADLIGRPCARVDTRPGDRAATLDGMAIKVWWAAVVYETRLAVRWVRTLPHRR